MWRFGILTFLTIVLAGCSFITIDDPQPKEEEQNEPYAEPEQLINETPKIEISEVEEGSIEEQTNLQGFIEAVLHLDWRTRKNSDAEPIQYMAFGDSLTRGIGDESKQYGYTNRLVEVLERWPAITEVELDNRGKNGRRSDQLLKLLESGHYDEELPYVDFMTMTLGGNDIMKIVKADLFSLNKEMFDKELISFEARYRNIVAEIRARNSDAPLLLIGFYNPVSIITDEYTPFETIIDEWNDVIAQIATEDVNACFVPISDLFETNEGMVYHTDFFHPNASGYEQMTGRIIDYMKLCDIEQMSAGRIGIEE
ncbi:GDSL-type esterase/lipase family protein [Lysinibacillus sp. KU-BSD001]|uniref:GDSL-type esterase/lipase family protein n=1 Tax=Lysinibacillus sp. KU-BSD001 TaxID=3141328 RepID=UPI0036E843FB